MKHLDELIKFVEQLPDNQFNYAKYVETKGDANCGTIGCMIGFYPIWFPKARLMYKCVDPEADLWTIAPKDYPLLNTRMVVAKFHGISADLVEAIFYGCVEYQLEFELPVCELKVATKSDLINLLYTVKEKKL